MKTKNGSQRQKVSQVPSAACPPPRAGRWPGAVLLALLACFAGVARADDVRARAVRGDAQAQFELGRRYAEGNGGAQNSLAAARWFQKAALQNHAAAQYQLGRIYAEGEGVRHDWGAALTWFRAAAGQGHALAMNRLGVMVERGQGAPQDFAEAYKWYTLAAGTQQWVFATANREMLVRRMTAEQIAEGEARAAKSFAQADANERGEGVMPLEGGSPR
jgi:hypothetical protein